MNSTESAFALIQQNVNAQNLATTTQWVSIGVLSITAIILGITAWLIYKYTRATLDLRDTARNEIELSMLPLLVFEFDRSNETDYVMKIRNMGKGPALNIDVSSFTLKAEGKIYRADFRLEDYDILSPDDSKELKEIVYVNDEEMHGHSLLPYIHPHFAENNYEFNLRFDNSLGISYKTIIKTGKRGISILTPPKRLK